MGAGIEGTEETSVEPPVDDFYEEVDNEEDGDEIISEILHETVEQTAERSRKEAVEGKEPTQERGEDSGNQRQGNKGPELNAKSNGTPQPQAQNAGVIQPPQRFRAEAKEAWKNAPRVLQEEYQKAIHDLQAGQTQRLREIHNIRQQAETVVSAISPWAKDWATKGISASQGVALLAETHAAMVDNPAKELARLAQDNRVSAEQIQAYMEGRGGDEGNSGTGYGADISNHPQFVALQSKVNQWENSQRQQTIAVETDKVRALRDEVDGNGNRPYAEILNPAFLQYAQPLVQALRTPPRDANGRFVGAPKLSIVDAYKQAFHTWQAQNGITPQTQPTRNQPHSQPQRQARPVSMRSRTAPAGGVPRGGRNGNTEQFKNETVEETMRRLSANNWQE